MFWFNGYIFSYLSVISKLEELRGHKVIPVMSHTLGGGGGGEGVKRLIFNHEKLIEIKKSGFLVHED